MRDGEDPMGKLHADRAATTVDALAEQYLEFAKPDLAPGPSKRTRR